MTKFRSKNNLILTLITLFSLYRVDAVRGQNGCAGDDFNDGNKSFPSSRTSVLTPFDPRFDSNYLAFRGKTFPYMAFGNNRGINYSLGFEYGFNKRNSLSLDLIYNDFQNLVDVFDTVKNKFVEGHPKYMVDRGAFMSYRYYFSKYSWRDKKGLVPYLSGFLRFGNHQYFNYKGVITNTVSEMQWHYSGGILVGILKIFQTKHDRFGIDLNAGIYEKEKFFHTVYTDGHVDQRNAWYTNVTAGINFYYWFYRKKKE